MSRWHEPAPGEREAGERSWRVVRSAFAEREPVPRQRARWPIVAVAAGVAAAAAALSPPELAVLDSIRDAVRGEPNAKPALFSLPAPGRLLVNSERGAWVVEPDGSKRLLAGYRDASWSPRGLYLVAVKGQELVALEPDGDVHWSLARSGRLAAPRWSDETPPCCRIAYRAGGSLRVVNGDKTGDRLLARPVRTVAPAWRPGGHVVAYADAEGPIVAVDADSGKRLWVAPTQLPLVSLAWSADGSRLIALSTHSVNVFDGRGHAVGSERLDTEAVGGAVAPNGHRFAVVERGRATGRSVLELFSADNPHRKMAVFAGAGEFSDVTWSPNGRWLLLTWPAADQWLFIRSAAVRKLIPVSNVGAAFGRDVSIGGWCCP